MSVAARPLAGLTVNLSISDSGESLSYGFPSWQVNRVSLQFAAALFGQGASIAFGHDWRQDGVMEAVYGFAIQVQAPLPLDSDAAQAEWQPVMRNLLPWPDVSQLSAEDQEKLGATLRIERVGLPEELRSLEAEAIEAGPKSELYVYLRSRGLTFLRHQLTEISHARLCIGGPRSGSQGRYPGIVEEALLAVQDHRPLYVSSFLGGAAKQIVAAIQGEQMPEDFCPESQISRIYRSAPDPVRNRARRSDRTIDRISVWREFSELGIRRLSLRNGLSVAENEELLHTSVVDRAIELVLTGLSRIKNVEGG